MLELISFNFRLTSNSNSNGDWTWGSFVFGGKGLGLSEYFTNTNTNLNCKNGINMFKGMIEIVLKNTSFKKNNFLIREFFESLKYQVSISNDQISCRPTFFKRITSGGSFWAIDHFLIEVAGKETIVRIKLSRKNLAAVVLLYLIAMMGFYIHENMHLDAMIGFFGVLLVMCSLLIFLSISEIKKEIKLFSNS